MIIKVSFEVDIMDVVVCNKKAVFNAFNTFFKRKFTEMGLEVKKQVRFK